MQYSASWIRGASCFGSALLAYCCWPHAAQWLNPRPSVAAISSTPSWPAAIATPRDADSKTIAEKAFSGGRTFTTPAFIATAPNITPDIETGIGSWSDAEIKRALVQGMRPDHGR